MSTTTQEHGIAFSINKNTWQLKVSKLKEQFPHLTDADLEYVDGKTEDLIDRLHKKIGHVVGKTKEGLHKFIDAL